MVKFLAFTGGMLLGVQAAVVINEIADKGSSGACGGEDWVELFNSGTVDVPLAGWVLHDDKGKDDKDAFHFPGGLIISPGQYLGLCTQTTGGPQFKIGGADTITLVDANDKVISTSGVLLDKGAKDKTWALRDDGSYDYTYTATYEQANVITAARDDGIYDPAKLIIVDIQMTQEDWLYINSKRRNFTAMFTPECCLCKPVPSPYEWREANITYNGETRERVGIKIKGFGGSISDVKPSLKIKVDKFVQNRLLFGKRNLVLNNNVHDRSRVNQYLSYYLFRKAGIIAPFVNYAHVKVNGMDLGIYLNLEPLKDGVLQRHGIDVNKVQLWEGALSDFRHPVMTASFEAKNDATEKAGKGDIVAASNALTVPDDQLEAAIDQHFDFDNYLTFWAIEQLIFHFDGFSCTGNNYFVYRNAQQRFVFLPWGTDTTFFRPFPYYKAEHILAGVQLSSRAYAHPTLRKRFTDRLWQLFDQLWNQSELLAEVDRINDLLYDIDMSNDVVDGAGKLMRYFIPEAKDFISNRKAYLETELANGPVAAPPSGRESHCATTTTTTMVVINEIADKGSTGVCGGEDWVELFNSGTVDVPLAGWVLHDDKGKDDKDAFHFPASLTISPGQYLGFCTRTAGGPQFKIGGDDTITLVDANGNVVSTSGVLLDQGAKDKTWARKGDGSYEYTSSPTYEQANGLGETTPTLTTTSPPGVNCTEEGYRATLCPDGNYNPNNLIRWKDREPNLPTCNQVFHHENGWVYSLNRCESMQHWCCGPQRPAAGLISIEKHDQNTKFSAHMKGNIQQSDVEHRTGNMTMSATVDADGHVGLS